MVQQRIKNTELKMNGGTPLGNCLLSECVSVSVSHLSPTLS